jgi:threonylcarbamoyladenosine tRNA methylthiotransferase MtaB
MDQVVPMKIRNRRSKMLRNLSVKKRRNFYQENLGTEEIVLFENDIENGQMFGFTRNYIRVSAKFDPLLINETFPVYLSGINENGVMEVREIPSRVAI